MKMTWIPIVIGGLLLQPIAFADVSYQETTQITGGSLQSMLKLAGAFSSQAKQANAPITSTVALHGNRMVRSNPHSTQIIDLDQQTITSIDHDKHTYSVVTFQQMQQAMADAAAKAGAQSKSSTDPNSNNAQMSFDAHISSNGTTRSIDGRDAKEALLTVTMLANANDGSNTKGGMAATSEMWLVSDVPGEEELRAFNQRMAKELAMDTSATQMSGILSAQPGGAQALADLKREAAKMSGLPVLQVTQVGVSADGKPLPAPSVAPMAQSRRSGSGVGHEAATDASTQVASDQISNKLGSLGRALGGSGMGALMRHKPSNSPNTAAPVSNNGADPATAGVLLESQTETGNFSTAPVDLNSFQIPQGYKQVTSPMAHH